MRKIFRVIGTLSLALLCACSPALSWASGPIILGGDDLNGHGSRSAAGVNLDGWKYIELAVDDVLGSGNLTRPGPFTADIAVLGSSFPGVGVYPAGNGGGAISSVGNVLGLNVQYYNTAATINTFFTDLASGTVNPKMLYSPGDDVANDLDASESAALTANALAINNFVGSGGGLMSHGGTAAVYGWLQTLIPGLIVTAQSQSGTNHLTPAGQALFPSLTDAEISTGPSHNYFTGDFGNLEVLAHNAFTGTPSRVLILGGITALTGPAVDSDTINVYLGDTVNYTFTGADADGDPLTWAFLGLNPPGSIAPSFNTLTQQFLWDTTGSGLGTFLARASATDPSGLSDTGVLTINVIERPDPSAVPEPSTFVLAGLGLAGLGLLAWRRRRS